ncbi:LEF11 [Orgyia pseudotsugata single capsid nuclopolyhedrovirus]|nr:LEF11 [Orgyia pseudotsugata single capsid nuclopolyhedrovirus]
MESASAEDSVGDATRADEHCECLTRSEVYALVREVINKRKHTNDTASVCDHVESVGFEAQTAYIRENLERVVISVGDGRPRRKHLSLHSRRLQNIFNLKVNLEEEYQFCTQTRNGGSQRANLCRHRKQVRKQRFKQKQQ